MVVTVDETETHASDRVEREFTIAKKILNYLEITKVYNGKEGFNDSFDRGYVLGADHGVVSGDVVILGTNDDIDYDVGTYVLSDSNGDWDLDDSCYLVGTDGSNYQFNYKENGAVATITVTPKALTGSLLLDIYYGDTVKSVGSDSYYYEYTITEEEYGVVAGDSVLLRVLYESPNAGAEESSFGLYMENNYVIGDLSINNTIISQKTIQLPEIEYVAEYTGTNSFTIDVSGYANDGDTLTMTFTAVSSGSMGLPISAIGNYENVRFLKIAYSDDENYAVEFPTSGYSLEIIPKKITNLDLKITEAAYNNGKLTLIAKDGIVNDEVVTVTITNYSSVSVGDVIELVVSESSMGPGNEFIEFETSTNYQFAPVENDIVGTITIVAACDVQFDGSCNCGTSHLTETLTFTGGEDVGKSATIACDSTYEGGIYKIALEGGEYEFFGTDQFFNISGIYDANGNKLADSIGTYILPQGTYYFHVYVGNSPSSDTIWVKKTAKILDAATMANAIVPDMEPGNSDACVRIHNLQTHNGGDTFVLFYNAGENIDALGQTIYFRYEDGGEGSSATSNIESIEFYDVNGIQLNVTYNGADMNAASGVTAVGGVYIVVTMNREGMDNLYFYAF